MDVFARQKKFVKSLEENLFDQFRQSLVTFGFKLEDYIVEKQLFEKGIDGTGKRLPGYARTTIRIKIKKGQPVDRTTLRDENKFHPSIEVDAFEDRFEVSSNLTHAKWIIKRYGQKVLQPTNENMAEFMSLYFIPKFKDYVNNQITR